MRPVGRRSLPFFPRRRIIQRNEEPIFEIELEKKENETPPSNIIEFANAKTSRNR